MAYSASFVEFFSEEAKRIEGGILPGPTPSKRIMVPASAPTHHRPSNPSLPGEFLEEDWLFPSPYPPIQSPPV